MITERLATFVANRSAEDISDDVYDAARDAVIDTLGVALAGSREPVADIAAEWVSEIGARSSATVWGRTLSSHGAEAAFANGVSAHALDFDDSNPAGKGHISACLVPTVLTLGQVSGASGQDVLAAYALGLETAGIIGRVFGPGHKGRGWHPTVTVGMLATTTAAGRLVGLDADGMASAWGNAASQVGGLVRNFGTMTKSFHAGRAAQTGIVAASFAKKGFTADKTIFDGAGNFLDVYSGGDGQPIDAVIQTLGDPWTIISPGNNVKRWPCCYSAHRTIAALFELMEKHDITAENVTEVSIGFLPGGDASLICTDPHTGLEGKFSVEYIVAAMLLDGPLRMATFTDAMVQRPEIRRLMELVRRIHIPDEKYYSGVDGYNDIIVTTKNERFEVREDRISGSRAWPVSDQERDAKFIDCASTILDDSQSADLLDQIKDIRAADDVRALVKATIPLG
jgi:2-methylcitrate dehydratase PrpD